LQDAPRSTFSGQPLSKHVRDSHTSGSGSKRMSQFFVSTKNAREREIEQGEGPNNVAQSLNVSRRTLYRALSGTIASKQKSQ